MDSHGHLPEARKVFRLSQNSVSNLVVELFGYFRKRFVEKRQMLFELTYLKNINVMGEFVEYFVLDD